MIDTFLDRVKREAGKLKNKLEEKYNTAQSNHSHNGSDGQYLEGKDQMAEQSNDESFELPRKRRLPFQSLSPGVEAVENPIQLPAISDEVLIAEIPKEYFSSDFNAVVDTINLMPEPFCEASIDEARMLTIRELNAVSKKLFEKVMTNHERFVAEMQKLSTVKSELQIAEVVCKNGRNCVEKAEELLVRKSLDIVRRHRRKENLQRVLEEVICIKQLCMKHEMAKDILKDESPDFAKCLSLVIECKNELKKHTKYACVRDLQYEVQVTCESIEEMLDQALNDLCFCFNGKQYCNILQSYALLGRLDRALDQLHIHFTTVVHDATMHLVTHFVDKASRRRDCNNNRGGAKEQEKSAGSEFEDRMASILDYKQKCRDLVKYDLQKDSQSRPVYLECLADMCKFCGEILFNHHSIMAFTESKEGGKQLWGIFKDNSSTLKSTFFRKLNFGRVSIWEDVQFKVSVLLKAKDVSLLQLNDFMFLMKCVSNLESLGREFIRFSSGDIVGDAGEYFAKEDLTNSHSNFILRDIIKSKSVLYFKSFHRAKMDDIKTMLENDVWQKCPLQKGFSIYKLKEYSGILSATQSVEHLRSVFPICKGTDTKLDSLRCEMVHCKYFLREKSLQKWFAKGSHSPEVENTFVNVLLAGWTPETGSAPSTGGESNSMVERVASPAVDTDELLTDPLLSSVSLNLVRLVGTYIEMMKSFRPLSYHIFVGLTQLCDYYIYAIYLFFGSPALASDIYEPNEYLASKRCLSDRLRSMLARLQAIITNTTVGKIDNRMSRECSKEEVTSDASSNSQSVDATAAKKTLPPKKVYEKILETRFPRPNMMTDINLFNNLFGLEHRVIAVESLQFVSYALRLVKTSIEEILPLDSSLPSKSLESLQQKFKKFIQNFYSNTVDIVPELRLFMYKNISLKCVGFEKVFDEIVAAKWDLKEIASEQSMYCDILVKRFELFGVLIDGVPSIPKTVYMSIWDLSIRNAMDILVHGFSKVKRCNNEGRALMLLDLQFFVSKLENISPIMPIPYRDCVENFIRAFYLNECDFENFVSKHRDSFTAAQFCNLVNTGLSSGLNKKARQGLLAAVEHIYNNDKVNVCKNASQAAANSSSSSKSAVSVAT
eukprot:Nk52_evm37s1401 gene=Nk52_evmTU37s1401